MRPARLLALALLLGACQSRPAAEPEGESAGDVREAGKVEAPSAAPATSLSGAPEGGAPIEARISMGQDVLVVASSNPERPRLRYPDGQLSRNESCFIKLGNKLNPKVPPLYINGNPIGFC